MKQSDINEIIYPAGRKIVRDHMREMLRIGETHENIRALKRSLRSLEDLLKKKRMVTSTTFKTVNTLNLPPQ